MRDQVVIRPLECSSEYRAVEALQREVWGFEDVAIVPDHVLIAVQKSGGQVLGAFLSPSAADDGDSSLIGFVFGFLGHGPDGAIHHHSHMAAVAPGHQNKNLGYALKLAQRERVLAQGIDLMTWTFDPLESRNAHLNFHKLAAICRTYIREFYGRMRDDLNQAMPSDRFYVEWHLATARVAERLVGARSPRSLDAVEAAGVPLLNPPRPGPLPMPGSAPLGFTARRLLVQIPADIQALKALDMGLAAAWRAHTRELFETAFEMGYAVVDLLFDGRRSCYLLEQGAWADDR
jgi:predicted GNAT superfamily acetyltransferase